MNPLLTLPFQRSASASIASDHTAARRRARDPHTDIGSGTAATAAYLGDSVALDESHRFLRHQPGDEAQPTMTVTGLLEEQDILLGMHAKGKRSALARITARLGERAGMSQSAVLAALLRRERLGSTAIGRGVAIPHAQLDGIFTPAAMVATLQRPVWFDAPDSYPVDLLLAVLWPKSDGAGFLPALTHFCRLLRHPELRDRIRASGTPAEALAWMASFEAESLSQPTAIL
ncbi:MULTISPECIES: PTS sugar transporter subunit IIA [unclassified Mesorhizobium]|uniref:PTS sugar transporter subunit IIA n=1 Tax=unclassified Mesorhizobium TaxID=325217 RepID=UPI00112C63EF|nr:MULTISPECIES: PTS sugar transporter subunit IIA [unclassified Mesorhizobium]MBZ9811057.1 PTS sugar transporter subunit IIA [Mesorhizobium sp. ESP-6-2]TPM27822.1 PTS sugar transporter subunit IIA [Mesorhizobium sp. B2-2-2]